MAVERNPNINAPNPKAPIIIPLMKPFLFGNHSHAHMTGVQYEHPIPIG